MSYERNPSEDLVWDENTGEYVSANFTLTISPTPGDATVVLTATGYTQIGNTISVPNGTNVSYTVSKEGYITVTDTVTVTQTQTIAVTLVQGYTLTVVPTPSDATVVLTATGYTQTGNSIVVPANTSVSYSVSAPGYTTLSSSTTVTQTTTINVTLVSNIIEEISISGTVYDIHSKAVVNQNPATGADEFIYNWVGTLAEYNTQDIANTHPEWVCLITDDSPTGEGANIYTKVQIDEMFVDLLFDIYPVGTIYGGNVTTCPLAALMPGTTWTLLPANKALWTGTGSNQGTTIAAGLPNITGTFYGQNAALASGSGAFVTGSNPYGGTVSASNANNQMFFDASRSNSIYGNANTVQPDAYVSNFWIRTA